MANVRFVNGDQNIGADLPETVMCPKGHPWGHSPDCPWLTIQFSVDQLAKIGGGTLHVANHQYDENVVMSGAKYSHISIVGELHGAITKPVDAQFCEQRPLLAAANPANPVVTVKGGAMDMRLENLNLSKGAHGVAAADVDTMKLIACCVHDNTSALEAGAGFLFESCSHVRVQRCRVFANKATHPVSGMGGGGMLYECDDITVDGCYFHSNTAELAGGALRIDKCPKDSKVAIDGNIFGDKDAALFPTGAGITKPIALNPNPLGNQANFGGAISIDHCPDADIRIGMTKANKQFANEARHSGGALAIELSTCRIGQDNFLHNQAHQNGGAVYLHNGFEVAFEGTLLQQNKAEMGHGGAIYAAGEGFDAGGIMVIAPARFAVTSAELHANTAGGFGGGICAMLNVSARIAKSTFSDRNTAQSGGGLYFAGATEHRDVEIIDCTFEDNNADILGGGCHIEDAVALVRDSRFIRNAALRGGGLGFRGVKPPKPAPGPAHGPAFMPRRNSLTLEHCSFEVNKAPDGGGAYIQDATVGTVQENTVFANLSGFHFFGDTIRTLHVILNRLASNKDNTGAVRDIVSDSDESTPPITQAFLVAGNFVTAAGVVVK